MSDVPYTIPEAREACLSTILDNLDALKRRLEEPTGDEGYNDSVALAEVCAFILHGIGQLRGLDAFLDGERPLDPPEELERAAHDKSCELAVDGALRLSGTEVPPDTDNPIPSVLLVAALFSAGRAIEAADIVDGQHPGYAELG